MLAISTSQQEHVSASSVKSPFRQCPAQSLALTSVALSFGFLAISPSVLVVNLRGKDIGKFCSIFSLYDYIIESFDCHPIRPVASLTSQGGTANIHNTYIYIIHAFRAGTESNFKSLGGPCPPGPLGYGPASHIHPVRIAYSLRRRFPHGAWNDAWTYGFELFIVNVRKNARILHSCKMQLVSPCYFSPIGYPTHFPSHFMSCPTSEQIFKDHYYADRLANFLERFSLNASFPSKIIHEVSCPLTVRRSFHTLPNSSPPPYPEL